MSKIYAGADTVVTRLARNAQEEKQRTGPPAGTTYTLDFDGRSNEELMDDIALNMALYTYDGVDLRNDGDVIFVEPPSNITIHDPYRIEFRVTHADGLTDDSWFELTPSGAKIFSDEFGSGFAYGNGDVRLHLTQMATDDERGFTGLAKMNGSPAVEPTAGEYAGAILCCIDKVNRRMYAYFNSVGWQYIAFGDTSPLVSPITTQDDIWVGGASGANTRLAKGADGQILRVNPDSHHLEWYTLTVPSGTVTNVGLVMPPEFIVSNSPVDDEGELTAEWAPVGANTFLRGPTSGGADEPTFGPLVAADLPPHSHSYMTNPMTTAGDIIKGGTSGAPERLAASTDLNSVLGLVGGAPSYVKGVLPIYTSHAATTVTQTSDTSLLADGAITLPANFFIDRRLIQVNLVGYISTADDTQSGRLKLKLGSTSVLDTTPTTLNALLTQAGFEFTGWLLCYTTGTTATIMGWGKVSLDMGNALDFSSPLVRYIRKTTASNVTTTGTLALDVMHAFGASGNTLVITGAEIRAIN